MMGAAPRTGRGLSSDTVHRRPSQRSKVWPRHRSFLDARTRSLPTGSDLHALDDAVLGKVTRALRPSVTIACRTQLQRPAMLLRAVQSVPAVDQSIGGLIPANYAPKYGGEPCRRADPPPWAR